MGDIENTIRHLRARNFTEKQMNIAIEALEKQIPKKIKKSPYHTLDKGTILKCVCPSCGRAFWEKVHIACYCDSCGQKLEID